MRVLASTLTPGSIAAWLTFVVVAAVALLVYRGGGGAAIGELRAANDVLTKRLHNLNDEKRELEQAVAELRGRTDVALALTPIVEAIHAHDERITGSLRDHDVRVTRWMEAHDARADERQTAILGVLGQIANLLGPENGRARAA